MKNQLFKIFLRINGFGVLTTFIMIVIAKMVIQSAKSIEQDVEMRRNCFMPFFTEILATGTALFIALSTIGIFFNLNTKFRQSRIRIAFSFFVLPVLVSIYLWCSLFLNEASDKQTIFIAITIYFPVWFIIIREYLKFIKNF